MSDWDITLDGVDYMLMPGSYRAHHDGPAERRTERQRLAGFEAGLSQPRPVAGGGLLAGMRAWPAPWPLGVGGIGPAPDGQAVSGSIGSSAPKLAASDQDYLYIVAGSTVYRWDRVIDNAPVSRKTLVANGTCMARLKNTLYIGHGAAADVSLYDDATNALTVARCRADMLRRELDRLDEEHDGVGRIWRPSVPRSATCPGGSLEIIQSVITPSICGTSADTLNVYWPAR